MKRRDFVKSIFYTSSPAASGMTLPIGQAIAGHKYNNVQRTLVNIMLLGGADLRYLFVPDATDTSQATYIAKFWESRKAIYQNNAANLAKYPDYASVFQDLYLPVESNGVRFGIHKNAQWLRDQFVAGNAAVIANAVASTNRRHDHSQLIMHTGDLAANQFVYDRNGWGGRFANAIGADTNVVPVSTGVSPYCNSVDTGNRLKQVVHVKDSRNFALPVGNTNPVSAQSVMGRALKAYYAKHGADVEARVQAGQLPQNWPFRKFVLHEKSLRTFGDSFASRLTTVMPNQPTRLKALYGQSSTANNNLYRLYQTGFGRQCANLYDCMLAQDILQLRSAYMEYHGWDTHRAQKNRFERNIDDLFGKDGGLDMLTQHLEAVPGANEGLVYVFTSDFGRQIRANGDRGTDHGEGSYMIVLGRQVNGGAYGEMFPQSEVTPDATTNLTRFDIQGADIEGRTSFERILGEVCDWVAPASGLSVFPNTAKNDLSTYPDGPILETNVDLETLFRPGYAISGEIAIGGYPNQYLADATVTATNSNGVTKTTLSINSTLGAYRVAELADNTFTVTPSKEYFTFSPAQASVSVNGSDLFDVNFTAIPQLHISAVYYKNVYWNDNTMNVIIVGGYNFEPGQTTVTVGSTVATIPSISKTYLWFLVPVTLTSGQIKITTSTESYVHPVLYENL